MTCFHCGNSTRGTVGLYQGYVGGRGYQWGYECHNARACWHRWDMAQVAERKAA